MKKTDFVFRWWHCNHDSKASICAINYRPVGWECSVLTLEDMWFKPRQWQISHTFIYKSLFPCSVKNQTENVGAAFQPNLDVLHPQTRTWRFDHRLHVWSRKIEEKRNLYHFYFEYLSNNMCTYLFHWVIIKQENITKETRQNWH